MKNLQKTIEFLNLHGANIAVSTRNGYCAIDSANGQYNYFCGTKKECAAFLRGLEAVVYNVIKLQK